MLVFTYFIPSRLYFVSTVNEIKAFRFKDGGPISNFPGVYFEVLKVITKNHSVS